MFKLSPKIDSQTWLEKFTQHPIFKTIEAEEAEKVFATRQEAAQKINDLKNQQIRDSKRLRAELAKAEANHKKNMDAAKESGDVRDAARLALTSSNLGFGSAISRQSKILIDTYDPKIDEAILFFQTKHDEIRRKKPHNTGLGVLRNIFTDSKDTSVKTNKPAIDAAVQYCRDSIQKLQGMKLEPIVDKAKVRAMKNSIPSVDIYTEFTGEKPLQRDVSRDPLHRVFPPDDAIDFEIKTLGKRVEKLIKSHV